MSIKSPHILDPFFKVYHRKLLTQKCMAIFKAIDSKVAKAIYMPSDNVRHPFATPAAPDFRSTINQAKNTKCVYQRCIQNFNKGYGKNKEYRLLPYCPETLGSWGSRNCPNWIQVPLFILKGYG